MYKVLFRPILKRTLSEINERRLSLFERKVLRCIFGAKQENDGGENITMSCMKHLMN